MKQKQKYQRFKIKSNLSWLNDLPTRIKSVYLDQLLWKDCFNEVHNTYKRFFFKRKLKKREHVGIWGWNTWCGVHVLPVLVGKRIKTILKNTIEVGFNNLEPNTGLLPHAVIHEDRNFASKPTYKCYGGEHGEAYNLDNILCWAKMAMEYFLQTQELEWFLPKLQVIQHNLDFILDNFTNKFNPVLIYAGIEGDWTECTDWILDNANVNVNFLRTLLLFINSIKRIKQSKKGHYRQIKNLSIAQYQHIYNEMRTSFNNPVEKGGFWSKELGYYIHGNDGKGEIVHGDKYFESTANYFALLWNITEKSQEKILWEYIESHKTQIEMPYPVLTNFHPRTSARRKKYGKTVTNGDIWMVLGAHAAAARLQNGEIKQGTDMYKAIVDYELEHGVLHNCIYQDGSVNDSWDPEIANYGSLYVPLVLGVLGIDAVGNGLKFRLQPLEHMENLKMDFFITGKSYSFNLKWDNGVFWGGKIYERNNQTIKQIEKPDFLLHI